jgi:hypothetical protein
MATQCQIKTPENENTVVLHLRVSDDDDDDD